MHAFRFARRLLSPPALVLALALSGLAHAQTAPEAGVDATVQPGDDFFVHANGDWLKAARIPAGKPSWSARAEIAERTQRQLLEQRNAAGAAPPGSAARKLSDFLAAYRNDAVIEARGVAPLKPLLTRIDAIRGKAGLTRYLGEEMGADADPVNAGVYDSSHIVGFAVQAGFHGGKNWVAYLLQGGLGMPSRDHYLGAAPALQAQRVRHETAIARWLQLSGTAGGDPALRASAVMALEIAIARSHASAEASANESSADTLWTRADFARKAPGMDWGAFLAAAGLSRQPAFVAWQPSALKGVATLVASQPLPVWKDYLRARLIQRHLAVLPKAFSDAATTADERAELAWTAAQAALGEVVSQVYVERHFPAAQKAQVQLIASHVIAAFMQRVQNTSWLSPASRETALAKLKQVQFGIAYPARWPDLSTLTIAPTDALGNLQRLARHQRARALARLGQPVDRTEWWIAPHFVGASLSFQLNANNFAAALLQAPKFDPTASDAANYGAIGAILGHEVSHFVDTLGADYELDGRARRWWSNEDRARYQSAAEPLVQQFSACQPLPGAAVNGRLGLTENVADLAGLTAAFDAYRLALGGKARDGDELRRMDREFFVGFARSWRARHSDEALRALSASDHAPETCRVATVRNLDAWYEAFDVKPGQRLYLPPAERVRVW